MKRDPRLRQLSSDHHHALVLARFAERSAADHPSSPPPEQAWTQARARYDTELAPHFDVEERVLLPAMRHAGHGDLVDRTLAEHAAIRACVGEDVPGEPRAALARFAELLTAHVRFEERELFETAQVALDDAALDAVDRASRS